MIGELNRDQHLNVGDKLQTKSKETEGTLVLYLFSTHLLLYYYVVLFYITAAVCISLLLEITYHSPLPPLPPLPPRFPQTHP